MRCFQEVAVRPITFLLAVLAVAPLSSVIAQEGTTVQLGTRVRVTAVGYGLGTRVAELLAVEGDALDTLVLVPEPMFVEPEWRLAWELPRPIRLVTDTVRVPVAFVEKLEVFRGRGISGRRVARRALFVAGIGAFVGALVEVISTSEFCFFALDLGNLGKTECNKKLGSVSWRGVGTGFAAGAFIGALYGLTPTDRWEEVPLDRLRVTLVPKLDGQFALGVSVTF